MIVLPIWLWLLLFVIVAIASAVGWAKRNLVDRPESAHAVASGEPIPDAKVEATCRSQILNHERTASGQTRFVAFLHPLEFASWEVRARTPITVGLSERTLGVAYKRAAGMTNEDVVRRHSKDGVDFDITAWGGTNLYHIVDRRDIVAGQPDRRPGGFSYSVKTAKAQLTFLFRSNADLEVIDSWVQAQVQQTDDPAR